MNRATMLLGLAMPFAAQAFTLEYGNPDWPATERYCYWVEDGTGDVVYCEELGESNDTTDGAYHLGTLPVGGMLDFDDLAPGSFLLGVFGSTEVSLSHGSQAHIDAGDPDVFFHYFHAIHPALGFDVDVDHYRFTAEDAQCFQVCLHPASSYTNPSILPNDWAIEVYDAADQLLGAATGPIGPSNCVDAVGQGEITLKVWDASPTPRDQNPLTFPFMYRIVVDNSGGDVQREWYPDGDADGFGDPDGKVMLTCGDAGPGYALDGTDCDDGDATTFPGAQERCDGVDNDCDVDIDEGLPFAPYWPDVDDDGWGDASAAPTPFCAPPGDGWAPVPHDCDDDDPKTNPEGEEVCDGVDNDCDGRVDEGFGTPWWPDADGDGFGDATATPSFYCEHPGDGWAPSGTDCDDGDVAVNPKADETCNGVDDDCDGSVDEGLASTSYYPDADGDGHGDAGCAPVAFCDDPGEGWSTTRDDCDDTSASVHPGATEVPYDGIDQDCDGFDLCDADGDGFDAIACGGTDCDDTDADIHPGAPDAWYDGVDSDCAGNDDYDQDGDGHVSAEYADDYDGDLPADDCLDTDEFVVTECVRTWAQGGLSCTTGGGASGPWALIGLVLLARRRRRGA